jgi:hypothetical protein
VPSFKSQNATTATGRPTPNPNQKTPIPSPTNFRGEISAPVDTGSKQAGFGLRWNYRKQAEYSLVLMSFSQLMFLKLLHPGFAKGQQGLSERAAGCNAGADVDVAHQAEQGVVIDREPPISFVQLLIAGLLSGHPGLKIGFPKGGFPVTHGGRIARFPQTLFGDVGDKVANVEGRVSLAAEVEIDEPEAVYGLREFGRGRSRGG